MLKSRECLFKKARRLTSKKEAVFKDQATNQEKASIILELKESYPLKHLLRAASLSRSTFYYCIKHKELKDTELIGQILSLYHKHKGRYGYRRITLALRNLGLLINHKKVQRLMQQINLKSVIRVKKYKSYKGSERVTAANQLNRNFKSKELNSKWVTDVTEFKVSGKKLYLSPVMDLYNGEIISYELKTSPKLSLVTDMLARAIKSLPNSTNLMIHSDQGWHYKHPDYQQLLKAKGITQSMSRKGNCLDNASMESFFAVLKTELYYLRKWRSIKELKKAIREYIYYYNHFRIKLSLNGMSPVNYRTQ